MFILKLGLGLSVRLILMSYISETDKFGQEGKATYRQ